MVKKTCMFNYNWIKCTLRNRNTVVSTKIFYALIQFKFAYLQKPPATKGKTCSVHLAFFTATAFQMNITISKHVRKTGWATIWHGVALQPPIIWATYYPHMQLVLVFKIVIQVRKLNRRSAVVRLLITFPMGNCN